MPVADVVLPVAGLATRLLPLTKAVPKALLPLGGRTVLDHILDELRSAGTQRIVIVASPGDDALKRHLEPDPALAARMRDKGRPELAVWLDDPAGAMAVEFVTQPEPRGLGDALTHAAPALGDQFAIVLGDALVTDSVLPRLAATHDRESAALTIAVEQVAPERVSSYGIVDRRDDGSVAAIVEKPAVGTAPSRLAVAARYVATRALLDELERVKRGDDGEVSITEAIQRLLAAGEHVVAVPLQAGERRRDVGTIDSYAAAIADG
jgi:UTP--glucose-1-phosphate uridylyltransferase